ncbi:NTP transferase domain-containing protein [Aldersonia sp. NBC_00410]|uniref:nucleotidyltransferase family protein n=1 Tax=Aldersonia sp. NBC_00410 TaxID=2975954 RepID=UPI00224EFBB5|nr:NTP transferase domain-containing protein [Aldersonia sp. NBC_00410]MCX5045197.1 NTP transferase domain-containing protein [Aldersonia sp. NBC_00410]
MSRVGERLAGLLLAAGAGRRFGGPKALATVHGRSLLTTALDALRDGGCDPVLVVTGARGDEVAQRLPTGVTEIRCEKWSLGMGESLRAGLAALPATAADAALVHLVDLPDVGADVVRRLGSLTGTDVLARAAYGTGPGHPVLIGRRWWPDVIATARGDRGARDFLATRSDLVEIDCSDLAGGADVDYPDP